MKNEVFEAFNNGFFEVPGKRKSFGDISWSKHPTFEGVELKHIIKAEETGGAYSFHLVRIAPNCSILDHIHDPQLETIYNSEKQTQIRAGWVCFLNI